MDKAALEIIITFEYWVIFENYFMIFSQKILFAKVAVNIHMSGFGRSPSSDSILMSSTTIAVLVEHAPRPVAPPFWSPSNLKA